jgi:hypothetical protein
MVETKVILCDKCKKQVAEAKCKICEADICKRCELNFFIDVRFSSKNVKSNRNLKIGTFKICKTCFENSLIALDTNANDEPLSQRIIDYLKNEIVIGELDGHKQKTN